MESHASVGGDTASLGSDVGQYNNDAASNAGAGYNDEYDDSATDMQSIGPSTVAMLILFGSVTFATVGMAARTWLLGDNRAIRAALSITSPSHSRNGHQKMPRPLEYTYVSIYSLLHHVTLFGLALFAIYILEHHPPFPHEERAEFDSDYLMFLILGVVWIGWHSMERNDGKAEKGNGAEGGKGEKKKDDDVEEAGTMGGDDTSITTAGTSLLPRTATAGDQTVNSGKTSLEDVSLQQPRGGNTVESDQMASLLSDSEAASLVTNSIAGVHSNSSQSRCTGGYSRNTASTGSRHSRDSLERKMEEVLLDDDPDASLSPPELLPHHHLDAAQKLSRPSLCEIDPVNDILNVPQTLEWKGFMTIAFLAYQITNASSYVPVSAPEVDLEEALGTGGTVNVYYNLSRLFPTSFLFLTGYGHAAYFYKKSDYSFTRVLRVLFRMNFTVVFLCLSLGNPYVLYHAVPVHSYFFLLTYGTLCFLKRLNYSKYGLRIKMLGLGMLLFVIWDCDLGLFQLLNVPFFTSGPPAVGAPHGPMWEWYFRTYLHHWSSYVGTVYALNYPIMSLLLKKLEVMGAQTQILSKGIVGLSLLVATSIWAAGPLLSSSRFAYNATHPYFGFIPVLCYVYFRNVTKTMREYHLALFKSIGSLSLELYLLHHHVLLTSDGMTMLVLVPGYPKCNIVVVSVLLLYLARMINVLTVIISSMALPPNDETKSVRSLFILGAAVVSFYILALALDSLNASRLGTVATVIIICGVLLYQAIMDASWADYRDMGLRLAKAAASQSSGSGGGSATAFTVDESPVAKACPPLIGTMVILLLGVGWHFVALSGAAGGGQPESRLLPSSCEALANEGKWIPVDPCTSHQRGRSYREYGMGSLHSGACDDGDETALQWGWMVTPPSAQCHFRPRPPAELRSKLRTRTVVFLGDSMVRNLFHAACRALGDIDTGVYYDANLPTHSDITRSFGSVTLEYKWAPLAVDEVSKLKDLRSRSGSIKRRPDLVVVGGGAWDRLHVWATDEDQGSHKIAVKKLASELRALGSRGTPTVWFTPTTINTLALNNEEKRTQMSETGMEEMRTLYADLGVEDSADFVLDGPAFTSQRVAESYDGVHYPPGVYDAGVQILCNSLDWLLPALPSPDPRSPEGRFFPPRPGTMSNPFLGCMMLCFALIGLLFFDGYFGFSYLASVFVRVGGGGFGGSRDDGGNIFSVMPNDLYEEAFEPYHQRLKLPAIGSSSGGGRRAGKGPGAPNRQGSGGTHHEEILSLLASGNMGDASGSQGGNGGGGMMRRPR